MANTKLKTHASPAGPASAIHENGVVDSQLQRATDRADKRSTRDTPFDSMPENIEAVDHHLPQADGGPAAWRFLFAAFMVEAFQFGDRLLVTPDFTQLTSHHRLRTFFRCFPELLLRERALPRQPEHTRHWYFGHWHVLLGIACDDTSNTTLAAMAETDGLVGMGDDYSKPRRG